MKKNTMNYCIAVATAIILTVQHLHASPLQTTLSDSSRVILKDGRTIVGIIRKETDEIIRIENVNGVTEFPKSFVKSIAALPAPQAIQTVQDQSLKKSSPKIISSDSLVHIELTDKSTITGTILSQDGDSIRVQTSYGTVAISKSKIQALQAKPSRDQVKKEPELESEDWLNQRAVVHLSGGGAIRGTIVAVVPRKQLTIRTKQFGDLVYEFVDIDRIAKETGETSPDNGYNNVTTTGVRTSSRREFTFGVNAGVSLPQGDFGATSASSSSSLFGSAITGFVIGIEGCWHFASPIGLAGDVAVAVNKRDISFASSQGLSQSVDAGSWVTIWSLFGLQASGDISPDVALRASLLGGTIIGISPEIKYQVTTYGYPYGGSYSYETTIPSSTSTGFAFGVTGGLSFSRFSFGLKYFSGSPSYDIVSGKDKSSLSISLIAITVGLVF